MMGCTESGNFLYSSFFLADYLLRGFSFTAYVSKIHHPHYERDASRYVTPIPLSGFCACHPHLVTSIGFTVTRKSGITINKKEHGLRWADLVYDFCPF